jgi:hypothetical protein
LWLLNLKDICHSHSRCANLEQIWTTLQPQHQQRGGVCCQEEAQNTLDGFVHSAFFDMVLGLYCSTSYCRSSLATPQASCLFGIGFTIAFLYSSQKCPIAVLQLICGPHTKPAVSLALVFPLPFLVKAFITNTCLHNVTISTNLEICSFKMAIASKYPTLTNCWGTIDGSLTIRLDRALMINKGNKVWSPANGRNHDHYVSSRIKLYKCT